MAVNPLNGIGGIERKYPGKHLVKGDAQRVKITAGIDRAIHATGLFGRHVSQCSGNNSGRLGGLTFARQSRGNPEAGEPHFIGCKVYENVGRLDVFVDEPSPVELTESCCHVYCQAKEPT